MTADSLTPVVSEPQEVPHEYPAVRTDVPAATWTVRGLPALPGMILLWFLPKRVGPSLAAAGWRAAIMAHIVAAVFGPGLIARAYFFFSGPSFVVAFGPQGGTGLPDTGVVPMTIGERLRAPLAALAIAAHGSSSGAGWSWGPLLVLLGLETAVPLLAVALMPFAAAGERSGLLFGRCLRLSLWSTTMLLPLGVGFIVEPQVRRIFNLPDEWHPWHFVALAVFGLWWLFVWLRSGYRYAGPPDGPAWRPRIPRCEGCGYTIAHLRDSTNCPECGRPVVDSLPECRREPAFAAARTRRRRLRAFWSTLHELLSDATFFDRLAVHRDHAGARPFFLWACGLSAVLMFLLFAAAEVTFVEPRDLVHHWPRALVFAAAVFVAQVLFAGLVAAGVAAVGRQPLQPTAVMTFYALSSLVALAVGLTLVATALIVGGLTMDNFRSGSITLALVSILCAVALVSLGWAVVKSIHNAIRAFSRTRFANA